MTAPKKTGYDANDMTHLSGLSGVRKRPAMYIGSSDTKGKTHLAYEIIDNAVDEALAGYCTRIEITLHPDSSVEVHDNGRGIPVDINTKTKTSGLLLVLTELHAGGKFGGSGYKSAGGLHGVGASVVNALSERLNSTVYRDGKKYQLDFKRGEPGVFASEAIDSEFTKNKDIRETGKAPKGQTGTIIRYWPDPAIFTPGSITDAEAITTRARQTAFLVPGLAIHVRDLRNPDAIQEETYQYKGGLVDMVDYLTTGTPLCDIVNFQDTGSFKETVPVLDDKGQLHSQEVERAVEVNVAFRWNSGYDNETRSFVNVVSTPNGGTHVKGFERALLTGIRKGYEGTRLLTAKDDPVILEDVTEGLIAVVSVGLPEPQFVGQTKEELGTPGVLKIVQDITAQGVKAWIEGKKKAQARLVLEKIANAAKNRVAARTQREAARRKTSLESASMPAKLVDCRATGVERSEIFIVEGDSALGCIFSTDIVATVEGFGISMEDLARDWDNGIAHFGYATDDNGDVVVVPLVEPRLTKKNAELVEVTLDNGSTIKCTPNHPFRLRDGSYKRADELISGDSLMPLYRKQSSNKNGSHQLNDYEMVFHNGRSTWNYTHHLSDAYNLSTGYYSKEDGTTRHHIDFNKYNNDPRNLRRMGSQEHFLFHVEHRDKNLANIEAGYRQWLDNGGREIMSAQLKAQWEDEVFRDMCLDRWRALQEDQAFQEKKLQGFQIWYASLSDSELEEYAEAMRAKQERYWADPANREIQSERVRQYFIDHPEHRENHREMGRAVWEDNEELLAWRSELTIQQFSDPAERERQRQAVFAWHAKNPEFGERHSAFMRERMSGDSEQNRHAQAGMAAYRDRTTKEEKAANINAGKLRKAIALLRTIPGYADMSETELRTAYDALRKQEAPTGFGQSRLWREFADNHEELVDAALNYNHTVVSVTPLQETGDVYDITVDTYHNFALEAGIFVHNSARGARNSEYQALLPIRGKILNVQKASLAQVLANAECASIIQVIGAGSGRTFDLEAMRYHRIILMADADEDGAHIRVLLLAVMMKYMRPALEAGRVYSAVPPLHKVETTGRGGETVFTYTKSEMENLVAKLEASGKTVKKPIPRFKGLGEMDSSELWETTMRPDTRTVRQITMGEAIEAEKTMELLMGSEVPPRRDWLIENSDRIDRESIDT